ncbi:MAG TPA: Calx-beta domain-containing protein [Pyrinomonadaceae bacterium]
MFSKLLFLTTVLITYGFFSVATAATFTVNVGGDASNGACDQTCTLREAINAANDNGAGADIIEFNLAAGNTVIQPLVRLPLITSSLTIDGTTQTGYFGAPVIVLDGALASATANGFLIVTPASNAPLSVSIHGLAINRFGAHGIYANCTNTCNLTIQGNRIGTNADGSVDLGNGADGINIIATDDSAYVIGGAGTFEGNVISGNEGDGIEIRSVSLDYLSAVGTATIAGNLIGTNAAGAAALGNSGSGVNIVTFSSLIFKLTLTVGGTTSGARNIISGNGQAGIAYEAHEVSIQNNYVGTNQAGTAALPNQSVGIYGGESFHAVIGGFTNSARNVVSGNGGDGIILGGKAEIYKNHIGTNAAGTAALGNDANGIYLFNSAVAVIGGTLTILNSPVDLGNVVSGNALSGIAVYTESPAEAYQIRRNRIGTNAAGDAAIPNQGFGIFMGFPGTMSNLPHIIGSETNAADGNLISGNAGAGIFVGGGYGNVKIFGNKIGTNLSGTAKIGNQAGIEIRSAGNQIGLAGNSVAANVISGNTGAGIILSGVSASNNSIYNNYVGTNASGADLGNGADGFYIYNAKNNRVGTNAADSGNRIAFNAGTGVEVFGDSTGNAVRGNSIRSNGALGIDLNSDGVTANDANDADAGANNLQNFPVIYQASPAQISGAINTHSLMLVKFDVYRADNCDASGYGEGRFYVSSFEGTTDANHNLSFNAAGFNLTAGQIIVMTATDAGGNTSEFSQCKIVSPAPGSVSFLVAAQTVNENAGTATVYVIRTNGTSGAITVDYATSNGTAIAGQDYTATSGTIAFNDGQNARSFEIPITSDAANEGNETINLTLTNPTGGAFLVNPTAAVLTIEDNNSTGPVNMGGTIKKSDNTPLAGVLVNLTGTQNLQTTTDSQGKYIFETLPSGGDYTIAPLLANHTFEPQNRQYQNLTANVSNADFTATFEVPRGLIIIGGFAAPGQAGTVTAEINSKGDENKISFSVDYDAALLSNPQVSLLPDAQAANAALTVNNSTSGKLGVTLTLPAGQTFPAGNHQLAALTFDTAMTNTASTPINFGDLPTTREILDVSGAVLASDYVNSFLFFQAPVQTIVRVVNADTSPGQQPLIPIMTDAQGTENNFAFTLNYDQSKLSNPLVTLGAGVPNDSILTLDTTQAGKIGVYAALPSGQSLTAGTKHLVTIRFDVAANAGGGKTALTFGDAPFVRQVFDANANILQSAFQNGAVNILGPSAASVSVGGRVSSASGSAIGQAVISMTCSSGEIRVAITNPFGYYRFDSVPAGETYIFNAADKRYQFSQPVQVRTINEEIDDINFVAVEPQVGEVRTIILQNAEMFTRMREAAHASAKAAK